jgi:hypothetical protein
VVAYEIEGLINDILWWREAGKDKSDRDNTALIFPFAQKEMVYMFMEGVDPGYMAFLETYLKALFQKYPEDIAKGLPKLSIKEKSAFIDKVRTQGASLVQDLLAALNNRKRDIHVNPVVETVAFLPVTELASMAESLVNLTSFKRRITMVAETVGGPIDVAVISKGDGFVWIKRKQYFDAESNPHFYARFYH